MRADGLAQSKFRGLMVELAAYRQAPKRSCSSNSLTEVRLRGGNPGQALVMIDGVPIGNVAGTDGSLDFGNLIALDIDRIEIVRGPQSSLYGSDAMSGVINIITKKGAKGKPVRTVTVEGGSYGTIQGRTSISGADENWTYSLGVSGMYTEGFPQYGYRVNRPLTIGDGVTPLPRSRRDVRTQGMDGHARLDHANTAGSTNANALDAPGAHGLANMARSASTSVSRPD